MFSRGEKPVERSVPTRSRSLSQSASQNTSTHTYRTPISQRPAKVYHYTLCPHTSPPTTRPMDIQPTDNNALDTRCGDCDMAHRRSLERDILRTYLSKILITEKQYGVFDAEFLDNQVMNLRRNRDKEVDWIWRGYSKRWGIGVVRKEDNGRVQLAWERPKKKQETGHQAEEDIWVQIARESPSRINKPEADLDPE